MNDQAQGARDDHLLLAKQLGRWLRTAGVADDVSGVDFADIVFAAKKVEGYLQELLECDPRRSSDMDRAATLIGNMHAWLFSELKHHAADLEAAWPALETRIDELGTSNETRE